MELTLGEAKPIIKYIIKNNKKLQERGQYPVAINIEGIAGIGKTSLIDTIAKELDYNYIFLSLSNLAEPSDLVGYPIKEHYVCKDDECTWIPSELLESYAKAGWNLTDETRMGYAIPSWLKGLDPNKGTIMLLDDFTRSTPAILACTMEVINRQQYISWKLPKNTTVLLSSNPDSGLFSVASLDSAQKSRYINLKVKFDINAWAAWAEEKQIDSRAINFLLQYHRELMDSSKTGEAKVNARNYTMFANTISGIPDWGKSESLAFILQIASGCFLGDDDDIVGSLFTTFIHNKLDKLMSPEDMVHNDWAYVKSKLLEQLYDGEQYRADIASILTTRFINYSMLWFSKSGKSDVIVNRIIEIVENDKMLLSEDLIFSMCKTLVKNYPVQSNKLLLNKTLIKKII